MLFITGVFTETYKLFLEMAPYLCIGFIFAGILHIYVTSEKIAHHLGKNNFMAVLKASLFGIPLPLCSCGVIPASMTLKKEGASPSAIVSFLITTPATGIDSIFATYALLGPVFAIFRVIASFLTGLISGIISIFMHIDDDVSKLNNNEVKSESCCSTKKTSENGFGKFFGIFKYGFGQLLSDVNNSLILGLFIGGFVTYIIPDNFFEAHIGNSFIEMIIMLAAGIPLYICSTGSIPLASALVLKGISPGAAFVFLLSGPATNAVTISVIGKEMGKKVLFIYIFSISFCSILFGYLMNLMYDFMSLDAVKHIHHGTESPLLHWTKIISALIIVFLLFISYYKKFANKFSDTPTKASDGFTFHIPNMTCGGCASNVSRILEKKHNILKIDIDIPKKTIFITGDQFQNIECSVIIDSLESGGYKATLLK
ncbi:SO_0444 family Cu/Zn efflux transporter [bacterium]|nr:SO_0444 family Cu/Zn efflux transporter [bacterium]